MASEIELEDESQLVIDDRQFATTLARGLEIVRCFTPTRSILSNRELSEQTGLSKPTVSRFTNTLSRLGYLRPDIETGRYRLGGALLTLAYPLLATIPLRQGVRPAMRKLAEKLGASVSLGMRERLSMVYVETSRSRGAQSNRYADIGMSHPIIATANGRAYLCGCTPEERKTLLEEIESKTPNNWERWSKSALQMTGRFESLGFCYSYGEYRSDVCAVAVPFRYESNGELYVFNCVLGTSMVTRGQLEKDIGPQVKEMVLSLNPL